MHVTENLALKEEPSEIAEASSKRLEARIRASQHFVDNSEYYTPIYEAIEKAKNRYECLIMVKGAGGIGKSIHIERGLLKLSLQYSTYQQITPATLPILLYENRNKVLWIRDASSVLSSKVAMDLIKGATETNLDKDHKYLPRMISLKKYSWLLEKTNIPKTFEYNGTIILDYNYISHRNYQADFNALKSRGCYIELTFSPDDMKKLMKSVAKTKWEHKVTDFITSKIAHRQVNLRMQQEAFKEYLYSTEKRFDWRERIIDNIIKRQTDNQRLVYSIIGNDKMPRSELERLLSSIDGWDTVSERTIRRRVDTMLNRKELIKRSKHIRDPLISLP